jgi:hypothetical protein
VTDQPVPYIGSNFCVPSAGNLQWIAPACAAMQRIRRRGARQCVASSARGSSRSERSSRTAKEHSPGLRLITRAHFAGVIKAGMTWPFGSSRSPRSQARPKIADNLSAPQLPAPSAGGQRVQAAERRHHPSGRSAQRESEFRRADAKHLRESLPVERAGNR